MKLKYSDLCEAIAAMSMICDKDSDTKLKIGFRTHNNPDYEKVVKEQNKQLLKKKLFLALLDKDGGVIVDEKGNYKYDKKGTQELFDYVEELNEKEIEFEFYKTDFNKLSKAEKEMFCKTTVVEGEKSVITYLNNVDKKMFERLSLFIDDLPEYKMLSDE